MSQAVSRLNEQSAVELAARLRARELGAVEVVEACLERIAERDGVVRAWTCTDPEAALERAHRLDAGPVLGPLHGLPIGVKDLIDTADLPTAYGSPIYAGHRPAADAACVATALEAGAVVLGKTATTELATFTPAATTNPRNRAHTPGGSSSGSAAAVADLMVPLAFGTQTLGSVIRPASFCGVVGYKPSFGRLSRCGVKLLAESLDTVGVFARSVADAALVVGALTARPELLTVARLSSRLRVGLVRVAGNAAAPEVGTVMDAAADSLARAGARVAVLELASELEALGDASEAIYAYEVWRNLAYERGRHRGALSARLQASLDAAGRVGAARYDEALAAARRCRVEVGAVMRDHDIVLAPSATGEAPEGLESTGDPIMNRAWTLLGLPSVNVRAGVGPRGLPVGLQVVGRFGDDARVLAAAAWIDERLGGRPGGRPGSGGQG